MDEYISREAMLILIAHNDKVAHYADERYENVVYATTQAICKVVAEMPAADVQPVKRGKWNTHDVVKVLCSGKTLDGFCQCEACGDVFPLVYSEYNYCPNCGARMDLDSVAHDRCSNYMDCDGSCFIDDTLCDCNGNIEKCKGR